MSPTQRSLKLLREGGYHSNIVERTIPYRFIKVDLFNWIDIVSARMCSACVAESLGQSTEGLKHEHGIVGVQVTSGSNFSARLKKAKHNQALQAWLSAGGRLLLHGWRKLKGKWAVRDYWLTMEDVL